MLSRRGTTAALCRLFSFTDLTLLSSSSHDHEMKQTALLGLALSYDFLYDNSPFIPLLILLLPDCQRLTQPCRPCQRSSSSWPIRRAPLRKTSIRPLTSCRRLSMSVRASCSWSWRSTMASNKRWSNSSYSNLVNRLLLVSCLDAWFRHWTCRFECLQINRSK